jgi:sugar transferase (PEP-CTERM/EpsH1 system associated)
MANKQEPPLIAHVIYSLGVGGLENGVVNLINNMPAEKYRHAIICIKNTTDFSLRIHRDNVEIYELNKREGQDWASFVRMYRLLKKLKPAIVHSRNLAAIEYQLPAFLAGVPHRIHGEHGWDVFDPDGTNKKYQRLRRFLNSIIDRFIPLSEHLESYLRDKVGIQSQKIVRICNGVDTEKFYPAAQKKPLPDCPLTFSPEFIYIGCVGRMHGVKDQLTLVRAFIRLLEKQPALKDSLRLIMIGDGPIREQAEALLATRNLLELAWLPGQRNDIAAIMQRLDIFVLPSKAEGISNTILEAMATALPVVATRVGGNPELVDDGETGVLVEKENNEAMANALLEYVNDAEKRQRHGQKALEKVQKQYSLQVMVDNYLAVYDAVAAQSIERNK